MLEYVFWSCLILILYPHIGYVCVLWMISLVKRTTPLVNQGTYQPRVSLLISAYNEEDCIERKIRNSLALDYPCDLLEIVVVSDGSTDRTNEIVTRYTAVGVKLHH